MPALFQIFWEKLFVHAPNHWKDILNAVVMTCIPTNEYTSLLYSALGNMWQTVGCRDTTPKKKKGLPVRPAQHRQSYVLYCNMHAAWNEPISKLH